MRSLLIALLCLVAVPAFGASGLTPDLISAGAGFDQVKGPGFEYNIVPISIEYAYSHDFSTYGTIHTAHRILSASGDASEPTSTINELSVLASYNVGREFRPFAGVIASLWGSGFTGTPEQLYGAEFGLSFPVDANVTMIVGGRAAWNWNRHGRGDLRQMGLLFGPAISL